MADATRVLLALILLGGCGITWRKPPVSTERRTALADAHLAKPLEGCLARALGSAESLSYLGSLGPAAGELQAHRIRLYVSPVSKDRYLDARVSERRCPDGEVVLQLSAAPNGTSYDGEPEILQLRLDTTLEHVTAICRAKVESFERGHMVDALPDTCAR